MDVFYHALTGIAISKSMGGADPALAAAAAVLPDIVGTIPFYYYKIQQARQSPQATFVPSLFALLTSSKFANATDAASYHITHSLFTALGLTILAYFIFPNSWHILSLCYISHILIDIPTHDGEFATRMFYPWNTRFQYGKNWAKSWRMSLAFWLYLGSYYLLIS